MLIRVNGDFYDFDYFNKRRYHIVFNEIIVFLNNTSNYIYTSN